MTEFTKGPWRAEKYVGREDSWFVRGPVDESICGRGSGFVNEANAHLIAAAPVVLAAIMEAVAAMRAYLPPDGIDKAEFIDRVIGALDNPDINPIIALADKWAKGG